MTMRADRHGRLVPPFLALLVAVLLAGLVPAAGVAAATTVLAPDADTYVRGGTSATRAFGTATTMWVRSDSGTANDGEAYVRFPLGGLATGITAARLRLTPTSLTFPKSLVIRVRLVADAGDGWTEAGLTHATRPADLSAAVTVAGTALAQGVPAWLDVTALLAQANANGIATFHVDVSSPDGKPAAYLAAREHATAAWRPALELTTGGSASPSPVPSATPAPTATPAPSPTPGTGPADPWPHRYVAPYVDATWWPTFDLVAAAQASGIRRYQLGFIVADSANRPSWGGYYTMADGFLQPAIASLRAMGGDVSASFGGAAGTELALRLTDVTALTAAYQAVVDAYALTHVDFDIEGAALGDGASVDRRNRAIARLQAAARAANRPLLVAYTLPVLPSGLTSAGRALVANALANGVVIDAVNVMAMDYGDAAAPSPEGRMGWYAAQAATSTVDQLRTIFANAGQARTDAQLWRLMGITPMIGVNDVTTEVFRPDDARYLLDFARGKDLRFLSFWSANRDRPATSAQAGQVSGAHCGLTTVAPHEFATILAPYAGTPAPSLSVGDASVTEGNAGTTTLSFPLSLVPAPAQPVTVTWATTAGTATAGTDYVAASGSVTFAAGQTAATVGVAVTGDTLVEGAETFGLAVTAPAGVAVADGAAVGTIRDDDGVTAAVTWTVTDDWGTGFGASVTIRNTGTEAWTSWTVAFDLPRTITGLWDGVLVSSADGRHVVGNAAWNGSVPPGGSVSFGFNGTTGSPPAPVNWVVNGRAL